MGYRWRYQAADGRDVAGPSEEFADQLDAETWLGEVWQQLLAAGVEQVTLFCGASAVYGPMSLRPADP